MIITCANWPTRGNKILNNLLVFNEPFPNSKPKKKRIIQNDPEGFEPTIPRYRVQCSTYCSMVDVVSEGGDLQYDLLTYCTGTLNTIAFTSLVLGRQDCSLKIHLSTKAVFIKVIDKCIIFFSTGETFPSYQASPPMAALYKGE